MYDKPPWAERKIQNNLNYIGKNLKNEFISEAITSSLEKKLNEFYSKTKKHSENDELNKTRQINKFISFLNGFDLNTPPLNLYEQLELLQPSEISSILQKREKYLKMMGRENNWVYIGLSMSLLGVISIIGIDVFGLSNFYKLPSLLLTSLGIGLSVANCAPVGNKCEFLNKIENNSKYKSYKHLEKLAKEADDFFKFVKEKKPLIF